ncbi:MAG: hypothetical protein QM751_03760 [Paludibacteraceae bacterium]
MDKLKKQIGESFFNPILYFLPLIFFIISNNLFGLNTAWKISFPVAIATILYVNMFYNRLFVWYIVLAASYIFIGLIYSLIHEYNLITPFYYYTDDLLFLSLMILILSFRKLMRNMARRTLHPCMPMTNNLDELFRVTRILLVVVTCFTLLFLILEYKYGELNHERIQWLNYAYLVVMLLIILYETVRVLYIRSRLIKESWIPIVTRQGKIVGSELYLERFFGKHKYLHPVIRMHVVEDGKILLRKNTKDSYAADFQLWDAALSDYVRMGESIQQALTRVTKSMYGVEFKKVAFLSNYSYENNANYEYVFLFVSCNIPPVNIINESIVTKWWTPKQIKDNFESGIFTEEFKHEYLLLERGGLISSVHCVCDCELKDLFRHQRQTDLSSQISAQPNLL